MEVATIQRAMNLHDAIDDTHGRAKQTVERVPLPTTDIKLAYSDPNTHSCHLGEIPCTC
jgi:hypothetical protein